MKTLISSPLESLIVYKRIYFINYHNIQIYILLSFFFYTEIMTYKGHIKFLALINIQC